MVIGSYYHISVVFYKNDANRAIVIAIFPLVRVADFKILRAVENVDNFAKYNWCQYCLDQLAVSLSSYTSKTSYVGVCLLLLQFCYIQRLLFRGIESPKIVPLIKHWTDEKVRERLDSEAGEWGIGELH